MVMLVCILTCDRDKQVRVKASYSMTLKLIKDGKLLPNSFPNPEFIS